MDNSIGSGALIINKPLGYTSFDVVAKIRKAYQTKSVGHTGTLDPMATGVMVILVGNATKASEYITCADKTYRAVLRLGEKTDSGDITGQVIQTCSFIPEESIVINAANSFLGKQQQIPPMYSALKVNGQKLVDLARKGIEIERDAREIEIFNIDCKKINPLEYSITTHCSKGTYIRTLCEDIAEKSGTVGTMSSLDRLASGFFKKEDALELDEIIDMSPERKKEILKPIDSLFGDWTPIELSDFYSRLAHNGAEIYQKKIGSSLELNRRIRLYDKNGFFALGEVRLYDGGSAIKPIKQFSGDNPQ